MKIAISRDHAAESLAASVAEHLKERGFELCDVSCGDYPESARAACRAVSDGSVDCGIIICGTGVGMSIVANKHAGIRCACCSEPYSAKLSRMHNDANMLAFGARVVGPELAKMIVDAFVDTAFEGGRHAERVARIEQL